MASPDSPLRRIDRLPPVPGSAMLFHSIELASSPLHARAQLATRLWPRHTTAAKPHTTRIGSQRWKWRGLGRIAAASLLIALLASSAFSQDEDETLKPGILVEYQLAQQSVSRVEHALGVDLKLGLPIDQQVDAPLTIRYQGWFLPDGREPFSWAITGTGTFRLQVADWRSEPISVEDGTSQFGPITTPGDWQPFILEARFENERGRFQVAWNSAAGNFEPLPLHRLAHEPDAAVESFTWGQALFRELRCAACHHPTAHVPSPSLAPSLAHRVADTDRQWLRQQLLGHDSASASRKMPRLSISDDQADDLLAYLGSQAITTTAPANEARSAPAAEPTFTAEQAQQGRALIASLGCLACHSSDNTSSPESLGAGPSLDQLGRARTTSYLTRWLKDPEQVDPRAAMPKIEMSDDEIEQIVAALTWERNPVAPLASPASNELSDAIERGAAWFDQKHCNACHGEAISPWLTLRLNRPAQTCLSLEHDPEASTPHFVLTEEERAALARYIDSVVKPADETQANETTPPSFRRLSPLEHLADHRCLSCHERGTASVGLTAAAEATQWLASDFDPSRLKAPSLTGVGDKLLEASLEATLQSGSTRREWLSTRMPVHGTAPWTVQLAKWFRQVDRLPDSLATQPKTLPSSQVLVHGPRLITSSGFGCTSCHALGSHRPSGTLPHALGPDLTNLGERIDRSWYERWVRDPSRMIPNMEMPSIRISVAGVLDDDLDAQIAALWQIANVPGFEPPRAEPERVVGHESLALDARALVIRDTMRTESRQWISPTAIGLSGRQNVLLDDESGALGSWWLGDLGRQYTAGKTWYWAPGGTPIFVRAADDAEFWIHDATNLKPPSPVAQFRTELLSWTHDAQSIITEHRIQLDPQQQPLGTARLQQQWQSLATSPMETVLQSGLRRQLKLSGLEPKSTVQWQVIPTSQVQFLDASVEATWTISSPIPWSIRFHSPVTLAPQPGSLLLSSDANGEIKLTVDYLTSSLPDRSLPVVQNVNGTAASRQERPDIVPGFIAERLVPDADWMPTSLAWRSPYELFVASLDGRIWRLVDQEQNGRWSVPELYAHSFAAPFGLFASQADAPAPYVDVLHKFGLLRLYDHDEDGQVDQVKRVAWGWGYTDDYHDWAVGLPRDPDGAYWIALACQQDQRTLAASRLRGTVVRLVPDPSRSDHYTIDEVSAGHRFPIGIARSSRGELFVTDNQGNFNPFNELNRVERGRRYGFLNAWERAQGLKFEETRPNVAIPHPWTRSVNGICFLESTGLSEPAFGPWTGHLIGCEYDTRRLIRISLDRVGEEVQGAVYPFSLESPEATEQLQGPLTCSVSPEGQLYLGAIRDSGWGGANNIGRLIKLRFDLALVPAGIAEVRATSNGFRIEFTKPIDRAIAAQLDRYQIVSYRRQSTPEYGGPDLDRRSEPLGRIDIDPEGRWVELQLTQDLRAGHVYQFQLNGFGAEQTFFPAEAHYTLNRIPER